MKAAVLHASLPAVWLLLACGHAHAQSIVKVSQVLPFASKGAVASLVKGEAVPPGVPPSGSTTETAITDTHGAATMALEGGSIVSGADGTSSLLLGTMGTARMGADSAVRVPEAKETTHSLELLKGRLFMNIRAEDLKQRGAGEFRLKTPAALLAVKGTKFFTISAGDTDTIGVHEGSVRVTEAMSGKELTLEAGSAVSVSPGLLSEVRTLTAEETGYTPEYSAAELVHTPIPIAIKSPVPNTNKLQVLLFQNGKLSVVGTEGMDRINYGTSLDPNIGLYFDWRVLKAGRNSIPVSPQLTAAGVVRYAWTAKQPGAQYQCFFDFGGQSLTDYSEESLSSISSLHKKRPHPWPKHLTGRPVAIQFRARSKNVSTAAFVDWTTRTTKAWPAQASEGEWVEVLLARHKSASQNFPYTHLVLSGSFFKQAVPGTKVMALEFADFVLLTTPK